jgi:hypothetical protein
VPAGRPRDPPAGPPGALRRPHPGHFADPAGAPSPTPAGRADRTHRAARGPSRVPPAGPPRHRPESGTWRGADRGDRPGGADFKGWRGRSSPRAPALNYARGIGRRGRIPDVAGESEILRRDKAARPGRSAGLSGQVSRANRSRRTRAGWRVPADQGQPANAGGPGPAGQRRRTRASRPAPADQAGRPRNGRQGRAACARAASCGADQCWRPVPGGALPGDPCWPPVWAAQRTSPGQASRTGRAEVPARRTPAPRTPASGHQDSNGGQHSASAPTGLLQARTGHQARRGPGAGHPRSRPGRPARAPGRGSGGRGEQQGEHPAQPDPQYRAHRLRRKQLATQDVSRRLAYPLALLPGVQQEL